jgi:hypothetical protein
VQVKGFPAPGVLYAWAFERKMEMGRFMEKGR